MICIIHTALVLCALKHEGKTIDHEFVYRYSSVVSYMCHTLCKVICYTRYSVSFLYMQNGNCRNSCICINDLFWRQRIELLLCNRKGLFINITDKPSIFYCVVDVSSMLTFFSYSSKILLWHTCLILSHFKPCEFTNVTIEIARLSYLLYLVIV